MKHLVLIFVSFFMGTTAFNQVINNASPNVGVQGTWSLPITISGSGTNFSAATNSILQIKQGNYQLEVLSATVVSPTLVNAIIRIPFTSPTGGYDITVYDQTYSSVSGLNGFSINASQNQPVIIETYPDSVNQNATLPVTISTQSTNFSQATDNTIYLTQGTHTLWPIPGSMQVLSNDSIRATFNFAQPFLSIGSLLNAHCGNSFDGILTDIESIEIVDSTLNRKKFEASESLSIYPNPSTNAVHINLPKGLVNFDLFVYNQLGQRLYSQSISNNTANVFTTDISTLPKGVYFVVLKSANKQYKVKMVKE